MGLLRAAYYIDRSMKSSAAAKRARQNQARSLANQAARNAKEIEDCRYKMEVAMKKGDRTAVAHWANRLSLLGVTPTMSAYGFKTLPVIPQQRDIDWFATALQQAFDANDIDNAARFSAVLDVWGIEVKAQLPDGSERAI